MQNSDIIRYHMSAHRTALLIRCSPQQALTIRKEALAQHRTISGYVLNVLERSLWIERKFGTGLESLAELPVPEVPDAKGTRTAILLHCSRESAGEIRRAAKRRRMSISRFAVFSLERHWRSIERLGGSPGIEVPHLS
jgi:uncharacterized protein (DUF1778 family)